MSEKIKLCELCEEQPATVLCSECYRCYCDSCSEFVHGKESKKEHKIETFYEGVRVNATCPIHKGNQLELFCIDEVKLCCAMCEREKLHKEHKVVKAEDITEDNKIFSASKVRAHFADVLKCDDDLDKKIEMTIENIKKETNNVKEKITQTFIEAHNKLKEEEAKVMEELEKMITESEGILGKNLETLREVRSYSIILNGVDAKVREKSSRLMELNIVNEMEKQRRTMEELHKMTMTNLKIGWDNEKRKLTFSKTLFNGAPVPKSISFPVVLSREFNISWDCDLSNMSEGDKDKIKYNVELKKTSEDEEDWKEIYSGKDKKCNAKGLVKDTEYNVRIKCVIGDLQGEWSDTVNVKTKNYEVNIDSSILSQESNKELFGNKLSEWCKTTNFELLYRGTRDGFGANDFHRTCDNKGKTLVIIKNSNGHIFGGFASISWTSSGSYRQAPGSFLFTLTNMHGIQPTKFSLNNENDGNAVYHKNGYGPIFGDGDGLWIYPDCNNNTKSNAQFSVYNDTTGKGGSVFSSNTSSVHFQVNNIEVFRVNV